MAWAGIGCTADTGPEWELQYNDGESGGIDTPRESPEDDCRNVSPAYDEVTAFNLCVTCHAATKTGAARSSAPTDVNFDTEAAADAHAYDAAGMVRSGVMPPARSGLKLTDAEKRQLYDWAECAESLHEAD